MRKKMFAAISCLMAFVILVAWTISVQAQSSSPSMVTVDGVTYTTVAKVVPKVKPEDSNKAVASPAENSNKTKTPPADPTPKSDSPARTGAENVVRFSLGFGNASSLGFGRYYDFGVGLRAEGRKVLGHLDARYSPNMRKWFVPGGGHGQSIHADAGLKVTNNIAAAGALDYSAYDNPDFGKRGIFAGLGFVGIFSTADRTLIEPSFFVMRKIGESVNGKSTHGANGGQTAFRAGLNVSRMFSRRFGFTGTGSLTYERFSQEGKPMSGLIPYIGGGLIIRFDRPQ